MTAIQPLSSDVIAQIAAGEVIERPVNVVKELVENSLDAQAQAISVQLREGGVAQIRVEDDGVGIPADSMLLAFRRHATSKLQTAAELTHLDTLGFRGEALYSIGAVSHVTLASRYRHETTGTRLRVECGAVGQPEPLGRPPGTVIRVENLFVNTPVRQRYLKSAAAEAGRVARLVQRYALAYPHVRFAYGHNGRTLLETRGRGDIREILYDLHAGDLAREALVFSAAADDISVSGYVSPPSIHFPNRSQIEIFVNGRWIQNRTLVHAVVQAFHGRLPIGRAPLALVFLEVKPDQVDVNVHPQKLDVRLLPDRRIYGILVRAIESALMEGMSVPDAAVQGQPIANGPSPAGTDAGAQSQSELALNLPSVELEMRNAAKLPMQPADAPAVMQVADLPPLNIIGQVGTMYIVAESAAGMVLVDQHAAHERVLYESWMARARDSRQEAARQNLLVPETLHTGLELAGIVMEHLSLLQRLGFDIEEFGGDTYRVRAIPALLSDRVPGTVLREVLQSLEQNRNLVREELEAHLVKLICKRAAIKAGQLLSFAEMEALLQQLGACQAPLTCPHGRPTIIQFTAHALEKAFGRT